MVEDQGKKGEKVEKDYRQRLRQMQLKERNTNMGFIHRMENDIRRSNKILAMHMSNQEYVKPHSLATPCQPTFESSVDEGGGSSGSGMEEGKLVQLKINKRTLTGIFLNE